MQIVGGRFAGEVGTVRRLSNGKAVVDIQREGRRMRQTLPLEDLVDLTLRVGHVVLVPARPSRPVLGDLIPMLNDLAEGTLQPEQFTAEVEAREAAGEAKDAALGATQLGVIRQVEGSVVSIVPVGGDGARSCRVDEAVRRKDLRPDEVAAAARELASKEADMRRIVWWAREAHRGVETLDDLRPRVAELEAQLEQEVASVVQDARRGALQADDVAAWWLEHYATLLFDYREYWSALVAELHGEREEEEAFALWQKLERHGQELRAIHPAVTHFGVSPHRTRQR